MHNVYECAALHIAIFLSSFPCPICSVFHFQLLSEIEWANEKQKKSISKLSGVLTTAEQQAAHNQIFIFPVEWKTIIYHIKRSIFYGNRRVYVRRDRPDRCYYAMFTVGCPFRIIFSLVKLEFPPQHTTAQLTHEWWLMNELSYINDDFKNIKFLPWFFLPLRTSLIRFVPSHCHQQTVGMWWKKKKIKIHRNKNELQKHFPFIFSSLSTESWFTLNLSHIHILSTYHSFKFLVRELNLPLRRYPLTISLNSHKTLNALLFSLSSQSSLIFQIP